MHDLLNALEIITNLEEATLLDLESTSEKKDLELLRPNRTLNPDRADESSLSTELGASPRRAHGSGRTAPGGRCMPWRSNRSPSWTT